MNVRLSSVLGNAQRLDGGAMFGNAPKALWSRWMTADDANRLGFACRTMLIEASGRRILCETGIGAFFPPHLRERYGVVSAEHDLLNNLAARGLGHEDIDVVVLSHLHFDHAGGLLTAFSETEAPQLLFPNATFVVGAEAFARAKRPHARDRASFIPELPQLLSDSGRLELVTGTTSTTLGDGYVLHRSDGHTPGLLLIEVSTDSGPVVFAGDLVPAVPWVHVPITMGYDRFPELLIDEKQALLTDLHQRGGWLFFTHDAEVSMGKIRRDDRGRFGIEQAMAQVDGWTG